MNLNKKKKIVLIVTVLIELTIGSFFIFNFYQQKIIHKVQDPAKIAVIKKENLIFSEESEFKYYYELKPSTEIIDEPEWLGYQAKYTYNSDGLNERFDYEVEKPSDTFRIITLGDSFTYGQFVNTKDNWTERLEILLNGSLEVDSKIKKFEVINLGVAGFDVRYLVKRYKDIGAKYKPDMVIWFESGEGFHRIVELIMPIIDACEQEISENDKKKEFYYCWDKAQEEIDAKYSYVETEQTIISYLDDFFSSLDQEKVLFFTFEDTVLNQKFLDTFQKWKTRYSQASFLSVVPNIYNLEQALADSHPNVNGHETISFSIYEYLKNNVLNQHK